MNLSTVSSKSVTAIDGKARRFSGASAAAEGGSPRTVIRGKVPLAEQLRSSIT